jgi:site-specific DNA recombinase
VPHGIDSLPAVKYLKAPPVDVFGKGLRRKLLASGSPLEKSYLNILVDEIVVKNKTAIIRASYAALAGTIQAMQKAKVGSLHEQVPTFDLNWCAGRDSNS